MGKRKSAAVVAFVRRRGLEMGRLNALVVRFPDVGYRLTVEDLEEQTTNPLHWAQATVMDTLDGGREWVGWGFDDRRLVWGGARVR